MTGKRSDCFSHCFDINILPATYKIIFEKEEIIFFWRFALNIEFHAFQLVWLWALCLFVCSEHLTKALDMKTERKTQKWELTKKSYSKPDNICHKIPRCSFIRKNWRFESNVSREKNKSWIVVRCQSVNPILRAEFHPLLYWMIFIKVFQLFHHSKYIQWFPYMIFIKVCQTSKYI